MQSLELSVVQKRILRSLVNLADQEEVPVEGSEIARKIDRTPGTIRNQMTSLSALQLVEGVPGKNGGYKPTVDAYDALDIEQLDDLEHVPIERDGEAVETASVMALHFSTVRHPDLCRAEVIVRGDLGPFEVGDSVTVGPTPSSGLLFSGVVDAVKRTEATLVVRARSMQAPTEESTG